MRIAARNRQVIPIRSHAATNRTEIRVIPYIQRPGEDQNVNQKTHVNMYGNRITKLGEPTDREDAVNVAYLETKLRAHAETIGRGVTEVENRCLAKSKSVHVIRGVQDGGDTSFFKPGAFNPTTTSVSVHLVLAPSEKLGAMSLYCKTPNSSSATSKTLTPKNKTESTADFQCTLEANCVYWFTMIGSAPNAVLTFVSV